MKFPKDFIDSLKQEFPDESGLHEMLEDGDPNVGQFLDQVLLLLNSSQNNNGPKIYRLEELYKSYSRLVEREKYQSLLNQIN